MMIRHPSVESVVAWGMIGFGVFRLLFSNFSLSWAFIIYGVVIIISLLVYDFFLFAKEKYQEAEVEKNTTWEAMGNKFKRIYAKIYWWWMDHKPRNIVIVTFAYLFIGIAVLLYIWMNYCEFP